MVCGWFRCFVLLIDLVLVLVFDGWYWFLVFVWWWGLVMWLSCCWLGFGFYWVDRCLIGFLLVWIFLCCFCLLRCEFWFGVGWNLLILECGCWEIVFGCFVFVLDWLWCYFIEMCGIVVYDCSVVGGR